MRAIVVIPTYNEAPNISPLVSEVLEQRDVAGVVIVDDNSPDGTGRIADDLRQPSLARVHVIHRPGKLGLGTAYLAGMAAALELAADRVVTMDADFSHRPEYLPRLLAASDAHELVIGSRYVPGGDVLNWGLHRRLLSRCANLMAHRALGLQARDCTAGYRCYHADLLRRLRLDRIRSSGYSFLIEMLFVCQGEGASVAEVPIVFDDRQFGASKISQVEIYRALQTVSRLMLKHAVRRPRAGGRVRVADGPVG